MEVYVVGIAGVMSSCTENRPVRDGRSDGAPPFRGAVFP